MIPRDPASIHAAYDMTLPVEARIALAQQRGDTAAEDLFRGEQTISPAPSDTATVPDVDFAALGAVGAGRAVGKQKRRRSGFSAAVRLGLAGVALTGATEGAVTAYNYVQSQQLRGHQIEISVGGRQVNLTFPQTQSHPSQLNGTTPGATATATKTPEASPYATAAQVNQAMADLQKAADSSPALKQQLESHASNVIHSHFLGGGAKLGVFNGIEGHRDGNLYAYGAVVGFELEKAMTLDQYNAILLGYTENSDGEIVVLPILYTGNHTIVTNKINDEVQYLSAQQMVQEIGDGTSRESYFAVLGLVLDTSNQDSQLHRAANTATANSLIGSGPRPSYSAFDTNSLPNLEGGNNIDLTIYTLDPLQS